MALNANNVSNFAREDILSNYKKRICNAFWCIMYIIQRHDKRKPQYLNFRSNSIRTNPAASHFRELQIPQVKRPSPFVDGRSLPSQMQSYRDFQYPGMRGNDEGGDMDVDLAGFGESPVVPHVSEAGGIGSQLSDDELQTLLVLLEEYRLQGKPASHGKSHQNFYTPPAQYFTPEMEVAGTSMGKRETGKRMSNRGPLVLEQPMSFENSLGGDSYPVFLNQKRSKRVGSPAMKKVLN